VAFGSAGNLYIADQANNLVLRSSNGTVTVIAGNGRPGFAGFSGDGGPATSATLSAPFGVAVDSSENIYIADSHNYRIRKVSPDGTITTVAGNGTPGFSGDGGPATSAQLNAPYGITLDAAGNLYISDTGNSRIRRVSGGIITTIAGNGTMGYSGDGGPAASASLNQPLSVTLDAAGNYYIADTDNNRVRKVSAAGVITTVAGNGIAGFSGDGGSATGAELDFPGAVALDAAGALYIADAFNGRVRKVFAGLIVTAAGGVNGGFSGDGGPATAASLGEPIGVALDGAGNLYIADECNGRIREVSNGTITTVAGNGSGFFSGDGGAATSATLHYPGGVTPDASGNLFIADTFNSRIRKVSGGMITTVAGNGSFGFSGDGVAATRASLSYPLGMATDAASNLYFADSGRIRKLSPSGTITTVAGNGSAGFGGDNGSATNASLNFPSAVALESTGNLYIADTRNNRIRKVSPGGIITTVAGNGTAGYTGDGGAAINAAINAPGGVAADAAGNLYIADTQNQRIRRVSNGIIQTVVGTGSQGSSGDGGPATSAGLSFPNALAVDNAGNLYFGDDHTRVRKVSGGAITTVAGNGTHTYCCDGGPAAAAALNNIGGVALDAAGNLYIADSENNRIREVLAANPTYQVTPQTLKFTAAAGGSAPAGQLLRLSAAVSGLAFGAVSSADWLTIIPSTGVLPAALQVTADPSTLPAGSFQATITIYVPDGSPATTTIAVTFTVQPAGVASLAVDTQSVNLAAAQGGAAVSQIVNVSNSGGGTLKFTVSATVTTPSGGSWLSVAPSSGTTPAPFAVTATPGSLAPGTYSGAVTLAGGGGTLSIPVTLSISAPTASILLSQSGLSFTAVSGGGAPLSKSFGILNTGQGSLNWTAVGSTSSGGKWLQIAPATGAVQRPYLDVSPVTVSIDHGALPAGIYYGQIQVTGGAVNSPQSITVILTVLPTGTTLPPQVFPAGLIFAGAAGVTPGSQDVQVANPAAAAVSYQSGIIGTGLDYLPKNATVAPSQPATLHVYPDFSGLSPGAIQHGFITLGFSDGSAQTISVLTVVAPAATGTTQATTRPKTASSCNGVHVLFRDPQPNQTTVNAVVGQGTTLDVQAVDGCGNPIGQQGQSASVSASFSNGQHVPMALIGNGIWQGTWKPLAPRTVTGFVTAFAIENGFAVGDQTQTLTFQIASAATPVVQQVAHAASDIGGIPISPGSLITIYGQNLADTSGLDNGLPLPPKLNGASVLLGNLSLPIVYASPGQLNVQVPYGVPVNTQYQLTVQHGNTLSVPQQLAVAQAQPGIFTMNQQGFGQGAIAKSDGITLAQPGTPAAIGEMVVIYCTGLGTVSPQVAEGVAPQGPPNLSTTDNPVTVMIGGQTAQVVFAGLTPGDPGLYQINAVVPSGTVTGDAVPVVITVAGQSSPANPAVTLAVR
jgi:uncharacterized protein (TIGR03437 family)